MRLPQNCASRIGLGKSQNENRQNLHYKTKLEFFKNRNCPLPRLYLAGLRSPRQPFPSDTAQAKEGTSSSIGST